MKFLLSIFSLTIIFGLSACSNTPSQSASEKNQQGIPSWVIKAPQTSKTQFVTVQKAPIIDHDIAQAKAMAHTLALQALNQQIQASFKKAQLPLHENKLDRGVLEQKVRAKIRHLIKLPTLAQNAPKETSYIDTVHQQVYVMASLNKQVFGQKQGSQQKRLAVLDKQLLDYLHVSQKGSHFDQLLSVLPALPTLEERQILKNYQAQLTGKPISLPQDRLAYQLNRQITILFDNLITGIEASTPDTKPNGDELAAALKQKGFNVSARRPDLLIKYYIESDDESTSGNNSVTLTNDIEVLNRDDSQMLTISSETTGQAKTKAAARAQAFAKLAQQVEDRVVDKAIKYIQAVNHLNHNRSLNQH